MAAPNFPNRTLYYGDNLPALRRMNSETVHLIATDPPFKKQRGFFSDAGGYDDRWTWQRDILGLDRKGNAIAENHDDWIDQIQDDWPGAWKVIDAARAAYGDDMGAFLCWLGVRLMEMRRILRTDGSIYVHIDHTAHAWTKALMDAIFGASNFKSEIVWRRTTSHSDAKGLGSVHDNILFYHKSPDSTWNPIFQPLDPEYIDKYYRYKDSNGRRFMSADLSGAGSGPSRNFRERGAIAPPTGRHWMYDDAGIERLLAENRIFWTKNGVPRLKVYLDEHSGMPAGDVWSDILPLRSWHKERTGYPTQKPLALYERIIQASSNPGDIVLDPFCGCATTPVAAERTGRQWVGMDIWDNAYTEVTNRLRHYGILTDDPKQDGQLNENGALQFTEYRLNLIDNKGKGEQFPARSDDNEVAAPVLNLRLQRPMEPWQQLSNALMRRILNEAQQRNGLVGCAGCGRLLEPDFFHLDHINPKSQGGENYITNRILICAPCNSRKSDTKTLKGLQNDNRRERWMKDRRQAEEMRSLAQMRAEWIRDNWGTAQCQEFIANLP